MGIVSVACTDEHAPAAPLGEDRRECGMVQLALDPQVLLVLDYSGSMVATWDHDDNPETDHLTRWHSLHSAVELIASEFEDTLQLGALVFPSDTGDGCGVPFQPQVPPARGNAQAMLAGIPAFDSIPTGATPMPEALEVAAKYLEGETGGAASAIILISDGAPSCGGTSTDATRIVEVALTRTNIPTYVVGIGIESGIAFEFAKVAKAGGRPASAQSPFYSVANEVQLRAALTEIGGSIRSCEIRIPKRPTYPDLMEIQVNGQTLSRVNDCKNESGWVYGKTSQNIVLCGDACNESKVAGAKFVADLHCPGGDASVY